MAIILEINDTDRSSEVSWKSLNLVRALTNQVDSLSFELVRANSSGYKPALNDKVEILENSVLIFGGQIISTSSEVNGLVEKMQITCKDYSFDMDKKLVVKVYEDMTVTDIIADINTYFLPSGYTLTNAVCPTVIKYISFNYELPTKCLQQLAQITNYDWYVDESKNIYFFLKGSQSAPFSLTDTSGNYIYNSLKINSDIRNLRNSIVVRGGKYDGATYTEDQEADGDKTAYIFAYQYSNYVVKINGVTKTVGIDNISDATAFDCLYNFNEKAVKFPTASKPTAGQIVTIQGNPKIPVVTKIADAGSVSTFGEFQYKIVDKSIASKESARDRARAELKQWADEINEGSFSTYSTGLKVGQKISIQSTNRTINDQYIISRITSTPRSNDEFTHTCTLVTKQTYGMIEFLQNLLINKDKEIEISSDEVLDLVLQLTDSCQLTDTVSVVGNTNTYKWEPSATSVSKWNFATWK